MLTCLVFLTQTTHGPWRQPELYPKCRYLIGVLVATQQAHHASVLVKKHSFATNTTEKGCCFFCELIWAAFVRHSQVIAEYLGANMAPSVTINSVDTKSRRAWTETSILCYLSSGGCRGCFGVVPVSESVEVAFQVGGSEKQEEIHTRADQLEILSVLHITISEYVFLLISQEDPQLISRL